MVYLLAFVGCSTAMSVSWRMFSWLRSLRSLISRRAVMGNCKKSECDWNCQVAASYAVFFVVHDNLLESVDAVCPS